jgi:hypothetical protein
MKRIVVTAAALATLVGAMALAAEMKEPKASHMTGPASPAALEPIKKLEGTWTGQAVSGTEKMDARVTYKVTASGSAVMEIMDPGGEYEMVTMYTADKDGLVLTHYCGAGNQPRMRARKGAVSNQIAFEFAGGANLDPRRDQFMHDVKLVFVDDDHLHTEWTSWRNGKAEGTMVFELARQK